MAENLTKAEIQAMTDEQKLTALLDICLSNSRKLSDIGDLKKEMIDFKNEVNERCQLTEDKVDLFDERLTKLEEAHSSHVKDTNKRYVLNDLYGKRFNVLFHGIPDNNVEDDFAAKQKNAEYILDELLCIPDYDQIKIIDTHRLPQKPVTKKKTTRNSRPVCRPIAIKVSSRSPEKLSHCKRREGKE